MPYPADHREKTRKRILQAARREMNRHGYAQTSIDGIMAEAGLTRGGFYAYFDSKEDLLTQIIHEMVETPFPLSEDCPYQHLSDFIDRYLSPQHRDWVTKGCSVPPLSPEIARSGDGVRDAFEVYAEAVCARVAGLVDEANPTEARNAAIAVLATCIGGVVLSRAVRNEVLSDEILAACRTAAKRQGDVKTDP